MPNKEVSISKKKGFNPKDWEPTPTHNDMKKATRSFDQSMFDAVKKTYAFEGSFQQHSGDPYTVFSRTGYDGTQEFTVYLGPLSPNLLKTFTSDEIDAIVKENLWGNKKEIKKWF